MKRRRRLVVLAVCAAAALAGVVILALGAMARGDAEHARFYRAGRDLGGFLHDYCAALENAHASGDVAPLAALYAPDAALSARSWDPPRRLAAATVETRREAGAGRTVLGAAPRDASAGPAVLGAATRDASAGPAVLGVEPGREASAGRTALAAAKVGEHLDGGAGRRVAVETELAAYLGELASLEDAACKIDLIEALDPDRRATLTVKRTVDGTDHDGLRLQDRLLDRWTLTRAGDGRAWRIARVELVRGTRVRGRGDGLEALDPATLGVDFVHRRDPRLDIRRPELRFGVVQHASGGVSVADYDLDGRPDLLLLDGQDSRLYRNLGPAPDPVPGAASATVPGGETSETDPVAGGKTGGEAASVPGRETSGAPRFADVTADAGLDGLGAARVGLFFDFDNDGDRDLFIGRYLLPNTLYVAERDAAGAVRFRDAGAELGLDATLATASATLLDYDRDGFLDLYVGVFGNAFEAVPRLPFYARNGGRNRLYRNAGGQGFVDVTDETGTGDTGWTLATAAADLDADGWPDLLVANDFGRKSFYRNQGPDERGEVTFDERARDAGILDFSGGMGLAVADFDDDGRPDLYTSNIHSNQRWFGEEMTVHQYMRNVARSRWLWTDLGEYWALYRLLGKDWTRLGQWIGEGNSLFRNLGVENGGGGDDGDDGGVRFEEVRGSDAERAGWGWGVAFFDYDNDADLDLYAANGWISAAPETDL